jgi:peptide-methionine (S)-S-oxide reductase
MFQRLLVACLGFALLLSLAAMAQSQKRSRRQGAPSTDSQSTTAASPDRGQESGGDQTQSAEKGKTQDTDKSAAAKKKPRLERATFGGGCFWCMEAVFERIPGVKSVVSGFAGGHVPNPTYEMVCTGLTGHAEVIQITYDPSVVSYDKLLGVFWTAHDPTTVNSQGPDYGPQYRSIILYHDDDQKAAAQKQYRELMAHRGRRSPIVTELVSLTEFYPAEPYHQDYYRNHPDSDYSQTYIVPKLRKFSKQKQHK